MSLNFICLTSNSLRGSIWMKHPAIESASVDSMLWCRSPMPRRSGLRMCSTICFVIRILKSEHASAFWWFVFKSHMSAYGYWTVSAYVCNIYIYTYIHKRVYIIVYECLVVSSSTLADATQVLGYPTTAAESWLVVSTSQPIDLNPCSAGQ